MAEVGPLFLGAIRWGTWQVSKVAFVQNNYAGFSISHVLLILANPVVRLLHHLRALTLTLLSAYLLPTLGLVSG